MLFFLNQMRRCSHANGQQNHQRRHCEQQEHPAPGQALCLRVIAASHCDLTARRWAVGPSNTWRNWGSGWSYFKYLVEPGSKLLISVYTAWAFTKSQPHFQLFICTRLPCTSKSLRKHSISGTDQIFMWANFSFSGSPESVQAESILLTRRSPEAEERGEDQPDINNFKRPA